MAEDLNKCQSEKVIVSEKEAVAAEVTNGIRSSKKRKLEFISDEFENGNVNLTNLNLEEDEAGIETETFTYNDSCTERSPSMEFVEESEKSKMEASPSPADPGEVIAPPFKLSAEELEEFFTAAENQIQTKFAEKYNFDIVNDVPLEGRFEWAALNP